VDAFGLRQGTFRQPSPETRIGGDTARRAGLSKTRTCVVNVHHKSRLSLRRPQCVSLRLGLNSRTAPRFKARMMPMRCLESDRLKGVSAPFPLLFLRGR
jgi:hypothetical protein